MKPWPYPLWVAHRGAGKLAPENTLAAFRVGAGHGYRAFECDVKLSADGVLFTVRVEAALTPPKVGDIVTLQASPEQLHWFDMATTQRIA